MIDVLDVLASRDDAYIGEPILIRDHCLQTAALAAAEGAPEALVAAALLHDIGHLLHSAGDDATDRGIDPRHEEIGARYLRSRFGPAVSEPVRLHVEAKRYLCGTNQAYHDALSEESRRTLVLQGGPFDAARAADWLRQPYAGDAVRLRRWDDRAKIVGLEVPGLLAREPLLLRLRRGDP